MKCDGCVYYVIINGVIEDICKKCFENKFSRFSDKKCTVCGKKDKQNYPYFFLKDNQLSLVCKECHDRVYGDGKE